MSSRSPITQRSGWFLAAVLSVVLTPLAFGLVVQIDPATYAGKYWGPSLWNVSGVQNPDVTLGTPYTVGLSSGTIGTFQVQDAGGGLYDVITSGGLTGGTGMASPAVGFSNHTVNLDRGNYVGSWEVDWVTPRTSADGTFVIPQGVNYTTFWAHSGMGNSFKFNVDSLGNVTVHSLTRPTAPITGGANAIDFADVLPMTVDAPDVVPTSFNWWQLDAGTPSYGRSGTEFLDQLIYLLPGNYGLIGDLDGFKSAPTPLSVPLDTTNWIQTITMNIGGTDYSWVFAGPQVIPEPAVLLLLGLGGWLCWRRRVGR